MANLIEDNELPGSLEAFAEETKKTPEVTAEAPPQVPEVPEKYKGKTLDDIVKMHQEAEKLIGKQAQEVGEVRRLADELLKQQLSSVKKEEPKSEEEEVDFFVDPKAAVKKAVDSHPDVVEARKTVQEMKQAKQLTSLADRHPDYKQVGSSPEFLQWVGASKVRQALFVAADQRMDTDAADELLSTFKELKGIQAQKATQEVKEASEATRKEALKAASVDTSGTGEVTKKIYRRADLIRLKIQDPQRYDAMSDEIMDAYREKRVR